MLDVCTVCNRPKDPVVIKGGPNPWCACSDITYGPGLDFSGPTGNDVAAMIKLAKALVLDDGKSLAVRSRANGIADALAWIQEGAPAPLPLPDPRRIDAAPHSR